MPNNLRDPVYTILVKVALFSFICFSSWLIWEHFSKQDPGYNDYSAANNAFEDKNYKYAYNSFIKAYKNNDKEVLIIEGIGRSLMELERYNESIQYFNLAIKTDANFIASYVNLGILYDRIGSHREAMKYYKLAINMDSELKDGMSLIDRILRGYIKKPATIKGRLEYLEKQYLLDKSDRILTIPAIDRLEPNYKK